MSCYVCLERESRQLQFMPTNICLCRGTNRICRPCWEKIKVQHRNKCPVCRTLYKPENQQIPQNNRRLSPDMSEEDRVIFYSLLEEDIRLTERNTPIEIQQASRDERHYRQLVETVRMYENRIAEIRRQQTKCCIIS